MKSPNPKSHTPKRHAIGLAAVSIALTILLGACATTGELRTEDTPDRTIYISPNASSGVQDSLSVPIDFTGYEDIRIRGYRFAVTDSEGTVVFERADQVGEPGRARFFERRRTVTVPESIEWDGRGRDGAFVADGEYSFTVRAWDAAGNDVTAGPFPVVVDNTPPSAEVHLGYDRFSPNGDGRLDSLLIRQPRSSEEEEWLGEIRDTSRSVVASQRWNGRVTNFTWDGTGGDDVVLPDGLYSYRLSSRDRAGNSFETTISDISLDTTPTGVTLAASGRFLSPNGDGRMDSVTLTPSLVTESGVTGWRLSYYNENGDVAAHVEGDGSVPATFVFTGRDQGSRRLPDGTYRAELTVEYANGSEPVGVSPLLTVDTVPPYATATAAVRLFSPDGDGRRDTLDILQSTSDELSWRGQILDRTDTVVRTHTWEGRAVTFEWDGRNNRGTIVPDGTYTYRLESTDRAGNRRTVTLPGLRVDTAVPEVRVSSSTRGLTRNRSGQYEPIPFDISSSQTSEVDSWSFRILTADGNTHAEPASSQSGRFPSRLTWDGRSSSGQLVDGSYIAEVTIEYEKGAIVPARLSTPVVVDTTAPSVDVTVSPKPFSPDGDGTDDVANIALRITDASRVGTWRATVVDPVGSTFRTFTGSGDTADIRWDGRSANGELVQSAYDYNLTVTATDAFGNAGSATEEIPVDILVQRDGDRLRIVISSITFEPFTADYRAVAPEEADRNIETLDRLAQILQRYPQYNIRIEGHAVRVYWNQPSRIAAEEENVLRPLSEQRAAVIKQALAERGIAANRMETAGFGGNRPVVPHGDLQNRWKNRRVEFQLIRQ